MRRVLVRYGVIAGLLTSLLVVPWDYEVYVQGQYLPAEITGYTGIALTPVIIFFAIRTCRQQYWDGAISWSRALVYGLYVWLIASIVHVIGVKMFTSFIMPDFWHNFADRALRELERDSTIRSAAAQIKETVYGHPIYYGWLRPFLKIFAPGLLFAPLCALILRKKPPSDMPAELHADTDSNSLDIGSNSFEVFDALGRSYTVPNMDGTLDISALPAGVYYVSEDTTNSAKERTRFVKE